MTVRAGGLVFTWRLEVLKEIFGFSGRREADRRLGHIVMFAVTKIGHLLGFHIVTPAQRRVVLVAPQFFFLGIFEPLLKLFKILHLFLHFETIRNIERWVHILKIVAKFDSTDDARAHHTFFLLPNIIDLSRFDLSIFFVHILKIAAGRAPGVYELGLLIRVAFSIQSVDLCLLDRR